jgi:hypothetical protein
MPPTVSLSALAVQGVVPLDLHTGKFEDVVVPATHAVPAGVTASP